MPELPRGTRRARLRFRKFKKHEMVGRDVKRSGPAPHRPTCVFRPSTDSVCWRPTDPTTTAPGTIRGDPGRDCGLAVYRKAQRRKFRRREGINAENRGASAPSTAVLLNFRRGRGRRARWQLRAEPAAHSECGAWWQIGRRSLRFAALNLARTSSLGRAITAMVRWQSTVMGGIHRWVADDARLSSAR